MNKKSRLIFIGSKTSEIKEFTLSFPKIFILIVLFLVITGLTLKYSIDFIVDFSQNSRIAQLKKENNFLQEQLVYMGTKITDLRTRVNDIEKMDDQFRAQFDLPLVGSDVRQVGVGGSSLELENRVGYSEYPFGQDLISALNVLEKLDREIKLEKLSYEELIGTMKVREDSLRYLPVLKPVPNARFTDGFGNRRHPILKRIKFHHGVDLAADKGTPVVAPADGYVTYARRNGGFGQFIKINHKYGYETCYGHLNKIFVRAGQYVKRGEKIGEVGSTGLSTSNHLHYEVHYKGKAINPSQFFLNDIVYY